MPAPVAADLPVYVISSVPTSTVPAVGKLSNAAKGIAVTEASIPELNVEETPAVSLFAPRPPVVKGIPFVLMFNHVTALVSKPME